MGQVPDLTEAEGVRGFWLHGRFYPLIAGGDGEPQEGDDAGKGGATGDGNDGGSEGAGETFDAAYVKRLRAEAASYRTEAKKLAEKLKEFEDQQLSETEKAKKDAAEARERAEKAEAKARSLAIRYEVMLHAAKMGCIDPEAAFALIDQASITVDEATGTPTNVEDVLKALAKNKAYLFGQKSGGSGGGSTTNPPSSAHGGKLTIEDVKKMSEAEINRRWDEVSAVLAGGK